MKAVCWYGKHDIRVMDVPEPEILNARDAIIKVTTTAICGSDLHLYNGVMPTMEKGDILGHEFMGEVVEVGKEITNLKKGDKVVVPFTIACGDCFFCKKEIWSGCDNSNPNPSVTQEMYGFTPSGLFGYTHMMGGFAGGQAEYVRVPYADVGPIKVPDHLDDEKVIFLSDIYPTGYQGAENCDIQEGDTIAVWGCGPVGQFAIKSAKMLGADKVFAIDHYKERLDLAVEENENVIPINFDDKDVYEQLKDQTGGHGPDACIDAVGLEAHGKTADAIYDYVKTNMYLATDRIHALRQAINCCRKGGTVSIPGVYGGYADKFNIGAAFGKGLTMKMGQTNMMKYLKPLLKSIEEEKIDPSFVISHELNIDEAANAYDKFNTDKNQWRKVVLKP
ncbi:MAG: glutathione-dependent formaldehyde dehydrogenase [Acidobacteriota bacterium]|jgi:threonine dehydrogenase-like Zn-dependent dehydrogenase|nr:glutathione-dependent formaldehyde dehydrogenase [Acidobacteriota bacterium]